MTADILAYRARRAPNRAAAALDPHEDAVEESHEPRIVVQTLADESARAADLAQLVAGLLKPVATIDPKYFYDRQGSALYGAICALDEYYPTRTEAAIFDRYRDEIAAALPREAQWIDLGCGDCAKSRAWLRALARESAGAGDSAPDDAAVARFIGVDIASDWLAPSLAGVAGEFPSIPCIGVVADFTHALDLRGLLAERPECPPVFFYPGSSIGNFDPETALAFLKTVRSHVDAHERGGRLLIGVDLVKDRATLEAAYEDALGVTAAFNRNALRVANRLIGSDFDPQGFEHVALFNADASRIEMHLRARAAHDVHIGERTRRFEAGETIVTEYSYKYTIESFGALLRAAGFDGLRCWTDDRGWFGVWLAGVDSAVNANG